MASNRGGSGAFVVGFLLGAAGGLIAALVTAPQSGEDTLDRFRERGASLRSQVARVGGRWEERQPEADWPAAAQAVQAEAQSLADQAAAAADDISSSSL